MLTTGNGYEVTVASFTPAMTLAGNIFFTLWKA